MDVAERLKDVAERLKAAVRSGPKVRRWRRRRRRRRLVARHRRSIVVCRGRLFFFSSLKTRFFFEKHVAIVERLVERRWSVGGASVRDEWRGLVSGGGWM